MNAYKLPKPEQIKIQEQIKASGMTQAAIAASMNVSINLIYDWTHGRSAVPVDSLSELWKLINKDEAMNQIISRIRSATNKLDNLARIFDSVGRYSEQLNQAMNDLNSALEIHTNGICADCVNQDGES